MSDFAPIAAWIMRGLSYVVVMVSSLGGMVLIAAAAPGFVRREREAARGGMRRCFLWGLVFVANAVLVAALLALVDGIIGRVLALAVMVSLLVVSLAGLAAVVGVVGKRVLASADRHAPSALAEIAVGTLVVFVTAIIPVFGWLVFAVALLTGIGAFLESAVEDFRPTRAAAPLPAPSAE